MHQKDELYAKEDFTDEDGVLAAELEGELAELGGWEAESDAESLLNGIGVASEYRMWDIPNTDLTERYLNINSYCYFTFNIICY